jgi:hypothetical protein
MAKQLPVVMKQEVPTEQLGNGLWRTMVMGKWDKLVREVAVGHYGEAWVAQIEHAYLMWSADKDQPLPLEAFVLLLAEYYDDKDPYDCLNYPPRRSIY